MSLADGMRDRLRRDDRRAVTTADATQTEAQEAVAPARGAAVADELPAPADSATATASGAPAPSKRSVEIPHGVAIATAWAWRVLLLAAAVFLLLQLLRFFSEVAVPVAVAVLITALAIPLVDLLHRLGIPRGLATAVVVIGGLAAIVGMLTLVGTQVANQISDLRGQVTQGLNQIQDWLQTGPLHMSDADLQSTIDRFKATFSSGNGQVVNTVTQAGTTFTHVAAGFFIVLFSTYFFLYEGHRIWGFLVSVFPRAGRERLDAAARVAWVSLTAFVRATVLVALTDAMGIAIGAALLGVPLALAIGVLVFIGAFVPLVGALVSGSVAVLVALVSQGFYTALFMLGVVVLVQQIEAHVLQPFLLGRLVSLHPLAVILGIAAGITVAGIVGALIAVPLIASGNAAVKYLAGTAYQPVPRRPIPRPRPRRAAT